MIKERIRATYHRLPYKALPVKVTKILVMESASELNCFPNKHGISKYYSPRQILHKKSLDYDHDCKYYFGQCVQAHEETTNTQAGRTKEALYMRPIEGGHQVYSLATDEVTRCTKVTPLPVPPSVIEAVNGVAAKQKQKGLRITAKNGTVQYPGFPVYASCVTHP